MSEFKKYGFEENKLKKADAKKAEGVESVSAVSEFSSARKKRGISAMVPVSMRKKKKFPIVVDIIVAIIMLAIVGGIFVGAYVLLKHYSNDYKGVDVKYTVVCEGDNVNTLASLINEEIYCDVEGNALYFGKVKEINIEKASGVEKVIMTVELGDVKYRDSEGYYVSDERLAVGASFTLRHGEKTFECTVVELAKANKGGK